MSTVTLAQLEAHDPAFAATKAGRTPTEYCWTATPALPLYLFDTRPELEEVTYLDADLLFFSSPEPLFAEMGDASVLITPHRFAPEYAHHEASGTYNVQFLTFRRAGGLEILRWWHDRCVEWCFNRLEDGKLGDQKYLDDWPERFAGVHVLAHLGAAAWRRGTSRGTRCGRRATGCGSTATSSSSSTTTASSSWRAARTSGTRRATGSTSATLASSTGPTCARSTRRSPRSAPCGPGFARGIDPAPTPRERARDAYLRGAEALVRRAPWVLRVRHPRGLP